MRSLLVLAFALVGCAHADSAADRQIEDLRRGLDQTEVEQDRLSQRASLITETPDERAARPVYPTAPGRDSGAMAGPGGLQRTVQIGQDDGVRENDDPNDPEARPEIRLQGPGGVSVPRASRKSRRESDEDAPRDSARSDPGRKRRGDAAESAAPKENR